MGPDFFFLVLVPYFKVKIPDPPAKRLLKVEPLHAYPRLDKEKFLSISVKVKYFSAITMFVERGVLSGHCYQPDINHRLVSFNSFHETYVTDGQSKPPLSDSMVYPTDENSFSGGNVMALYCYQVTQKNPDDQHKLYSPAAMGFRIKVNPARPKVMQFFGSGYIEGFGAKRVSSACFVRLLKIFGLTLSGDGPKNDVVSANDVAFFWSGLVQSLWTRLKR